MMLKKTFIALLCGLVFSFGFAPFDLWLLSILSLVLLLTLLNDSNRDVFLIGYFFGFGMWVTGISWLYVSIHYHGNVNIYGSILIILLFIAILALYSGLLFLLNNYFRKHSPKNLFFLTLPASWVIIELLRSYLFTGFPWLISGTMLANTVIDGFTPIIGAQGNTFFLILIATLVFQTFYKAKEKSSALFPLIVLLLIIPSSFFFKSIEWTSEENEIQVSVYQPNLTLEDKWSQFGVIKSEGMIERAIDNANHGELIVFPETALILAEKDNQSFLDRIRYKSFNKDITLISGIIEREDNSTIRNRLQAFGLSLIHI